MITRRTFIGTLCASPWIARSARAMDSAEAGSLDELVYPPFDALTAPVPFGLDEPTAAQKKQVSEIVLDTPKGPTPFAIAQSFVERFYPDQTKLISQWPTPEPWNPLIVEFFLATDMKAKNDLVPWCAAFTNWCLRRAGRNRSNNAGSQSFLRKEFEKVALPEIGDLAVFTCYDPGTNKSVGLGHVGFVAASPKAGAVKVLGGNQSLDGHSSVICERDYQTGDRIVRRRINDKMVKCVMSLNTYITIG